MGRTTDKAENHVLQGLLWGVLTPVLWPPHAKSWLTGKDPDAGRDWGQEDKGTTEDEMAGWHHWLDGRESRWTPGVGDGQGGLACCNSWGRKESDRTERLNWMPFPQPNPTQKADTGSTDSEASTVRAGWWWAVRGGGTSLAYLAGWALGS